MNLFLKGKGHGKWITFQISAGEQMNSHPMAPLVSEATVVYVGGINSSGEKAWRLRGNGYNVLLPKQGGSNFRAFACRFLPSFMSGVNKHISLLRQECLNICTKPDIVVGSSQGGAVAMSLVQKEWAGAKLLLIAPAWKTFGIKPIVPKDTTILHGMNDWLVSIQDSEQLCSENNCTLIKVNDDHVLSGSYKEILGGVTRLSKETGKHKPEWLIEKEWEEYRYQVAVNCTKGGIGYNFFGRHK